MYSKKLNDLLSYCLNNGRVCPLPAKWNELWKILTKDREVQDSLKLNPPLILAAWNESTDQEKMLRLKEQLVYADQNSLIDLAESYLHRLNETHWYHLED